MYVVGVVVFGRRGRDDAKFVVERSRADDVNRCCGSHVVDDDDSTPCSRSDDEDVQLCEAEMRAVAVDQLRSAPSREYRC